MPISPSYSSSFFFLFHRSTVFTEQLLLLQTVKQVLKYSYPGLRPFENSCFARQVQDIYQNA